MTPRSARTARQALNRATVVLLDSELTDTERAAAQAAYPAETFQAGIGEQLVAAEKLADRYDTARHGGEPHGWALVQTAIDWVRMDIGRPIRRFELTSLYPIYLRQVRPTDEPQSDLTEPLKWARTPVGSRIALLQPATDDTEAAYLPFDYLVGLADGQHGRDAVPIPDDAWSQAAGLTTPAERIRASLSAYYRRLPGPTRTLLLSVIESGDPDEAPKAMFGLGQLLAEQGDVEGARAAYQRAIDSGDREWATPAALVNLGVLLDQQGDVEGARAAYQQVIDSEHPKWALRATGGLGDLLAKQGDVEGARAAYQRVIDSGDPDESSAAMTRLGVLLDQQGDVEGARAAYQRAIADHPDHAPWAMINLGDLLAKQGDVEGARAAYQQVIDSEHPKWALRATGSLGDLLAKQGDVEGARAAYQRVIDSGDPDESPAAMRNLELLGQQGEK